jgi:hypothetical protein
MMAAGRCRLRRGGVVGALAAGLLFAPGTAAHAQRGADAPAQLPREFVDLLVARSGYGPSRGDYRIGALPTTLPGGSTFAAQGRVVGSVLWRDRTTTGIAVPIAVGAARERFEQLAADAGWAPKPAPPERRGFVPSLSTDPARGFCWPADDGQLSIQTYAMSRDTSYVVLQHYLPSENRSCAAPRVPGMRMGGLSDLMPTLRPPDGTELIGGGGSGSSGDRSETRAEVAGRIAPAALIAHFEPQLREQGWTIAERIGGEWAGVLSASKPRDGGGTLLLSVLAHRLSDDEQSLEMAITLRR